MVYAIICYANQNRISINIKDKNGNTPLILSYKLIILTKIIFIILILNVKNKNEKYLFLGAYYKNNTELFIMQKK